MYPLKPLSNIKLPKRMRFNLLLFVEFRIVSVFRQVIVSLIIIFQGFEMEISENLTLIYWRYWVCVCMCDLSHQHISTPIIMAKENKRWCRYKLSLADCALSVCSFIKVRMRQYFRMIQCQVVLGNINDGTLWEYCMKKIKSATTAVTPSFKAGSSGVTVLCQ